MSRLLLERCVDAAAQRGVSGDYSPWPPVDLLQTLLVDVHEALGCSWLSAIDTQLLERLHLFIQGIIIKEVNFKHLEVYDYMTI